MTSSQAADCSGDQAASLTASVDSSGLGVVWRRPRDQSLLEVVETGHNNAGRDPPIHDVPVLPEPQPAQRDQADSRQQQGDDQQQGARVAGKLALFLSRRTSGISHIRLALLREPKGILQGFAIDRRHLLSGSPRRRRSRK